MHSKHQHQFTMNDSKKYFRAKMDLPGCKNGRLIRKMPNLGKNHLNREFAPKYVYDDDGSACQYDCENEPKFFAEVLAPKHVVGKTVILKKASEVACCNEQGDKQRKQFTLPAFTELTIVGEKMSSGTLRVIVKFNDRFYLVSEKLIFKPEKYFYLSSKGVIHEAWLGRDEDADKHRKSVGNMHSTKHDVNVYRRVLQEQHQENLRLQTA